ncbi:MAG: hypothetical protein L3J89_13625 [Gammaproteobacteria bacterium]|nr:hypothetical protein [Gammaproteobacteria bacterium]
MIFGVKSGGIIKIQGKNFEDLSLSEIGLMIDADSSLSPNGNEFFSSCALDVFLHNTVLECPDLKTLQKGILDNIYLNVQGEKSKRINTEYLRQLSIDLRKRE